MGHFHFCYIEITSLILSKVIFLCWCWKSYVIFPIVFHSSNLSISHCLATNQECSRQMTDRQRTLCQYGFMACQHLVGKNAQIIKMHLDIWPVLPVRDHLNVIRVNIAYTFLTMLQTLLASQYETCKGHTLRPEKGSLVLIVICS